MDKELRCTQCGARVESDDSYCPKCHASISVQDIKNEQMIDGIEIEIWKKFIGDRAEKYVEIFKRYENKKIFSCFNPYAYFMGTRWMFYRGMYLYAIGLDVAALLLLILWAYITSISSPLMLTAFPIFFLLQFSVGLFSNCLYKYHIKNQIIKCKGKPERRTTSTIAVIIATVALLLAIIFIVQPIVMDLLLKI